MRSTARQSATKDIDLVVLAEAFDRSYFERFVSFVRAGGYEHRTKSDRYELYRFERPANKDFPPKIELLSQLPDSVRDEVAHFVEEQPWDDNMLRGWRLPVDSEGMADVIRSIYL